VPLQNRVTPHGDIVALPGRGTLMGNRGILHDDSRRIVRPYQVRRWIACALEFRGRTRTVMTPHRYTELFFLDEAAAFSAGHRPCAECRRVDYDRFRGLWGGGSGPRAKADAMDEVLDAERRDGKRKRTHRAEISALPDGTFVSDGTREWLLWQDGLFAWADSGYVERAERPTHAEVVVLTPPSIVEVFRAGYRPMVHPSAAVDRSGTPLRPVVP
jgi:hypothetical protein